MDAAVISILCIENPLIVINKLIKIRQTLCGINEPVRILALSQFNWNRVVSLKSVKDFEVVLLNWGYT